MHGNRSQEMGTGTTCKVHFSKVKQPQMHRSISTQRTLAGRVRSAFCLGEITFVRPLARELMTNPHLMKLEKNIQR